MKRISVELVPRDENIFRSQLQLLQDEIHDREIDVINIPDHPHYEIRSWQAAKLAKQHFAAVMPHIRAMDIDLAKPLPMAEALREDGIHEVLIIEGDAPQDMSYKVYPTETTDVIRKFREEMPEIRVYAGIDQYRSNMREELYRIRRKLQSGAVGFFTQPFFDMRLLEMYADMLSGIEMFWGVSPVMSTRSESYWELKNNVIFPRGFTPTLEWSIDFSRRVFDFAASHNNSIYMMPIKTNLLPYLQGVFAK
jgi:methylenetetrahydrofolate reductase (NADPH)